MSSNERGEGRPEEPFNREIEPIPYHRTAQFATDQLAGAAYKQARDTIYTDPGNEISVYRLRVNLDWYVAALGEVPRPDLGQQLEAIFAAGTPASLPAEVLHALALRRAQQRQYGDWVERRHRPPKQP